MEPVTDTAKDQSLVTLGANFTQDEVDGIKRLVARYGITINHLFRLVLRLSDKDIRRLLGTNTIDPRVEDLAPVLARQWFEERFSDFLEPSQFSWERPKLMAPEAIPAWQNHFRERARTILALLDSRKP